MSTIFFTIYILSLFTIISAIRGLRAPPVIYSAIIYNRQDAPIKCSITWSTALGNVLKGEPFFVAAAESYVVQEETDNMDSYTTRRIIRAVHCAGMDLNAPFPNVNSPSVNWKFYVGDDEIVSDGSA